MVRCSRCNCDGHKCNSKKCPFYRSPTYVTLESARKERDKYKKKYKELKRKQLTGARLKKFLKRKHKQHKSDLPITSADEERKNELVPDLQMQTSIEQSFRNSKPMLSNINSLNSQRPTLPRKERTSSSRSRSSSLSSTSSDSLPKDSQTESKERSIEKSKERSVEKNGTSRKLPEIEILTPNEVIKRKATSAERGAASTKRAKSEKIACSEKKDMTPAKKVVKRKEEPKSKSIMEELRDLEKKRAKQEEMLRQKEVELMSHRAEKEKEYSKEISRIKAQMSKPEGNGGTKLAEFAAEFNKVEMFIKTQLESLKKILNDIC